MHTNLTTSTLALTLALALPMFACAGDEQTPDSAELEALPTMAAADVDQLSTWEAQKLAEPDAALLIDHAEALGLAVVDLSFSYPVEGLALAELDVNAEQPAYLSFDLDADQDTLATLLVLPAPATAVYQVVDGAVVPLATDLGGELDLNMSEGPVETECHSWGNCDCGAFQLVVGMCLIHGLYTPAFYDCIRVWC